MQKVLIIGSEGSLGKFLVKDLSENYEVIRIGRRKQDTPKNYGDFLSPYFLERIFADHKDIKYVIHCAAHWNGFNNDFDIAYNNSSITLNILKHCNNIKHFVYVSSSGVYDNISKSTETSNINMDSSYRLSKFFSEKLVELKSIESGFTHTIWRPFHIVSPYETYNEGSSHICTNISHKIADQYIDIESFSQHKLIPLTWVGDVSDCIVSHMKDSRSFGQIFNIGNNEASLWNIACEIIKLSIDFNLISEKSKEAYDESIYKTPFAESSYSYNKFNKIKKVLGWWPKLSPQETILKFMKVKYIK